MKIACVLRSGGPYDGRYVRNLRAGVRHGLAGRPATFVCLTDVPDEVAADCDEVVVLEKNYPGWWSKLELFRLPGPCIYFDLDTLVVGDIGSLYEAVAAAAVGFWMLKPFLHTETWASGVMAWAGDWSSIYTDFDPERDFQYDWDQRYIWRAADRRGVPISAVQERIPELYSFKRHCQAGPPEGARVICFHGEPRPAKAAATVPWVARWWT